MNPLELLAEVQKIVQAAKDASNPNGPGGSAWTPRETTQFIAGVAHALADLATAAAPFLPNG